MSVSVKISRRTNAGLPAGARRSSQHRAALLRRLGFNRSKDSTHRRDRQAADRRGFRQENRMTLPVDRGGGGSRRIKFWYTAASGTSASRNRRGEPPPYHCVQAPAGRSEPSRSAFFPLGRRGARAAPPTIRPARNHRGEQASSMLRPIPGPYQSPILNGRNTPKTDR